MPEIADPMNGLRNFQRELDNGTQMEFRELNKSYFARFDEFPEGGKRYSYLKIMNGEIQAISMFGLVEPIKGVDCYSIGYAVNENYRRRGLALESVNLGLADLAVILGQMKMKKFYLEAVVDVDNMPSLILAKKLFSSLGLPTKDYPTGKPALYFKKLIVFG